MLLKVVDNEGHLRWVSVQQVREKGIGRQENRKKFGTHISILAVRVLAAYLQHQRCHVRWERLLRDFFVDQLHPTNQTVRSHDRDTDTVTDREPNQATRTQIIAVSKK